MKSWYQYIRPLFVYDDFSGHLVKGMQDTLDECIMERISRLKQFCLQLAISQEKGSIENKDQASAYPGNYENALTKMDLAEKIFDLEFKNNEMSDEGEAFIKTVEKRINRNGKKYINIIKSLEPDEQNQGSAWLLHIEQRIVEKLLIVQE